MNITVLGLTNPDVNLKRMHQLYNVVHVKHRNFEITLLQSNLINSKSVSGLEILFRNIRCLNYRAVDTNIYNTQR